MKVILLEDVKSLGKKGEVVKVSDGYARNMLIPRKLCLEATTKNLNDLKLQQKKAERKAQEELEKAQALAADVDRMTIHLRMKTGEGGRLFGSVSTKELAAAVKEQAGVELDKRKFVLPEPIKALGGYEVPVKLHPQVTGKLTVIVEAEE